MIEPATTTSNDGGSQRTSQAVIAAVADAEGVDPVDLDRPLYEAVDPEALDSLFRSSGRRELDGHVRFEYYGYEITVYGDGRLELAGN